MITSLLTLKLLPKLGVDPTRPQLSLLQLGGKETADVLECATLAAESVFHRKAGNVSAVLHLIWEFILIFANQVSSVPHKYMLLAEQTSVKLIVRMGKKTLHV